MWKTSFFKNSPTLIPLGGCVLANARNMKSSNLKKILIVSRFACPADPALRSAMFCAVISGGASEAIGLFRFVVLLIPFLLQNGAMEKNDSG